MRKRHANNERCHCGSGDRVGRCHDRPLNRLRERMGRYWFRAVEQQMLHEALASKSSGLRGTVMSSRPSDVASQALLEQFGRTQVRRGGMSQSPLMRAMLSPGFTRT